MTQSLILRYWDANVGHGNFGDELSPFVVQRLVDPSIKIAFNSERVDGNNIPGFISIGSYMQCAVPGDYIWGSGIRTWPQLEPPLHPLEAIASSLNIFALRGPLTREVLISLGARCADVPLGEPALLLSEFYQPGFNDLSSGRIVVIPNIATYEYFAGCSLPSEYHLVSPYEKWSDVADFIWSSKPVVSSSLHGLIRADAFGKPNAWMSYPEPHEGFFKYLDYFLSQGRALDYITNLDQLQSHSAVNDSGNRIDLVALKQAFPFARSETSSLRGNDRSSPPRVDLHDELHTSVLMSFVSLESIRISQKHTYDGCDLSSAELQLQCAAMSQSVDDLKQQLAEQAQALEQLKAELAGKSAALAQADAALSQVSGSLRQLVQR